MYERMRRESLTREEALEMLDPGSENTSDVVDRPRAATLTPVREIGWY